MVSRRLECLTMTINEQQQQQQRQKEPVDTCRWRNLRECVLLEEEEEEEEGNCAARVLMTNLYRTG